MITASGSPLSWPAIIGRYALSETGQDRDGSERNRIWGLGDRRQAMVGRIGRGIGRGAGERDYAGPEFHRHGLVVRRRPQRGVGWKSDQGREKEGVLCH